MDTIQQMKQHVSVRHYQDKEIPVEVKQDLLLAAQSGSTSNFVQAYSIIEIADHYIKSKLAEITKFSGHLNQAPLVYVFVADLYRQCCSITSASKKFASINKYGIFSRLYC